MDVAFERLEAVPIAFLARFCALGVAAAEVANQNFPCFRVKMGNFAGAGVYAFAASYTLRIVYRNGCSYLINAQSFEGASGNTWIVFALGAKVREFGAWNKHEDAYSGGFRPDFAFVSQGACDFAFSASAAF
jgi:hypothetical protein